MPEHFKHEQRWLDLTIVGNRFTRHSKMAGGDGTKTDFAPVDTEGFAFASVHAVAPNGATWSSGVFAMKGGLRKDQLADLDTPLSITNASGVQRSIEVEGDALLDGLVTTAEAVEVAVDVFLFGRKTA